MRMAKLSGAKVSKPSRIFHNTGVRLTATEKKTLLALSKYYGKSQSAVIRDLIRTRAAELGTPQPAPKAK